MVLRATWNPAREIKHEELGHLTVGAPADVAVLRIDRGKFGFVDSFGARLAGTQNLVCELTLRDGKVVYDLNGITRTRLGQAPQRLQADRRPRWDAVSPAEPKR